MLFDIFVILVLALAFRLILKQFRFAITADEVNYLKLAANAKLNGFSTVFHSFWTPMYPMIVTIFSFFINDIEMTGRLVSILFSCFLIIPIYYFANLVFGRKVAIVASLLLAFNPYLAFLSTRAQT